MIECEYKNYCLNNKNCYRCIEQNMLKLKGQRQSKKLSVPKAFNETNSKESWKELEKEVADKISNIPIIKNAKRTIASGALPFLKGDIDDLILHIECKERTGNELKTGDKSISIRKEWLIKAKNECKYTKKEMCLAFRFKNDKDIYCIMEFNDIVNLVTTMKSYIIDNELKDREIKRLKGQIDNR